MRSLKELFCWCRCEIACPRAAGEFDQLVQISSSIARYSTADLLVEVLEVVDSDGDVQILLEKDAVLLDLLEHYQRGHFRRLTSNILILAFARRLAALANRYCRRDERDEATSQLVGALLETAASYPLARRRSKVSANLAWETEKLLARRLVRERKRQLHEFEIARELQEAGSQSPLLDADVYREQPWLDADASSALARLERLGIIDTVDRELIETTVLYGWKLKECTEAGLWSRAGLTYKAAHCRLTRALKRIRDCAEMDSDPFAVQAGYEKDQKK